MTAEEAREQAKAQRILRDSIDFALEKIENAAKEGEFSIWFYGDLMKRHIEQLEVLGYKVTPSAYNNEVDFKVSWE